jgi:hypothetical protein
MNILEWHRSLPNVSCSCPICIRVVELLHDAVDRLPDTSDVFKTEKGTEEHVAEPLAHLETAILMVAWFYSRPDHSADMNFVVKTFAEMLDSRLAKVMELVPSRKSTRTFVTKPIHE